jgi:proline iminopeptidase
MPAPLLYPPTAPIRSELLAVPHGHRLQVQQFGRLDGIAALVLHGGPGSGCSPLLARFFDPALYRVICPDQRGAGASQPHGEVAHNSTADLLDDLRLLREHLQIEQWLVVGGSWGAALALAHAAADPRAVVALLLRGVFLARDQDLQWFFQGAASEQPEAWARFAAIAPAGQRHAVLAFLAQALIEGDVVQQRTAASAWWQWEQSLMNPHGRPPLPEAAALETLVGRYRVQAHYLRHRCWLDDPPLLDRCALVPPVPTLLLHGRNDRICLPEAASTLHQHLPHSRLQWVAGAGHDPCHPAMVAAMVSALDHYAAHRRWPEPA